MGYGLHIVRRNAPESESTIALAEWLAYVEEDKEFKRIDAFRATNPASGSSIEIPGDGMAVWMLASEDGPIFDFHDGRITVAARNRGVIPKMKAVAAALGANVVGDEGEEY